MEDPEETRACSELVGYYSLFYFRSPLLPLLFHTLLISKDKASEVAKLPSEPKTRGTMLFTKAPTFQYRPEITREKYLQANPIQSEEKIESFGM